MKRKQRLAALIATLSRPGDHRLDDLARHLNLNTALVHLDLADLMIAGYPIEGDPESGYRMVRLVHLPAMTLAEDELDALRQAISQLPGTKGASLSRLVDLATPDWFPGSDLDSLTADVPGVAMKECARYLPILRRVVRRAEWITLDYLDARGEASSRRLHPLGLERWSDVWALVAWCALRNDFRTFRLDRVTGLQLTGEPAPHRLGRDLATFKALHRQRDD
jgi:predicted DNA-binding transcriptional regulator YafY